MTRSMARVLAAIPEYAEVGHERLRLQREWEDDIEYHAQDPTWSPMQQTWVRDYESDSESRVSLTGAPLQNGSRPFHKVYRVDISALPQLKRRFIDDSEQHVLDHGDMESDYLYGVRTYARAMAKMVPAPEDIPDAGIGKEVQVPVRVEMWGERRWRSDWLRRTYDVRTIHVEVEDPLQCGAYLKELDEHRGQAELLPWKIFVRDLCRRPGDKPPKSHRGVVVHSEPEVFYYFMLFNAELCDLLWEFYTGGYRVGMEWFHNSGRISAYPVAPLRLFADELYQKEPSWAWGSLESTLRCERIAFSEYHEVLVVDGEDRETVEGKKRRYTINIGGGKKEKHSDVIDL